MALAGDHSDAIDERNYLGWILFLEFDLRIEELKSLDAGFATVVEDKVFSMPPFLWGTFSRWLVIRRRSRPLSLECSAFLATNLP